MYNWTSFRFKWEQLYVENLIFFSFGIELSYCLPLILKIDELERSDVVSYYPDDTS